MDKKLLYAIAYIIKHSDTKHSIQQNVDDAVLYVERDCKPLTWD